MFLVSLVNYQVLLEQIHWMYVVSLASLIAVLLFGQKYLGARRWIKMPGGGHFQPSEWVKLILILAVSKYFADLHERELSWPDFMKAGAIVGFPMLLVLAQPDLGTALTYLPVAVMGLFLGGFSWKQALIVVMILGVTAAGGVDQGVEAVSEGAVDEFPRSGCGPSGIRVSGKSVFNCGGIGRDLGKQPGIADASGVSAGAADRLYFCRVRGGTWVCRGSGGFAVILYSADAVDPECANGARPRRGISGDGCGGCA